MGYLGRDVVVGNYRRIDNISAQFNGAQTSFNLNVGGQPIVSPGIASQFLVSFNNVLLEPFSAYNIVAGQIVFVVAPVFGSYCWIVELGSTFDVGVPSDSSVTPQKLSTAYLPTFLDNRPEGYTVSCSKTVLGPTEPTILLVLGSDGACVEGFAYGTNRDRYIAAGPNGIVYSRAGNNLIESGRYNANAISTSHNNFPGSYGARSRKLYRNTMYSAAGNVTADTAVSLILGSITSSNSPAKLIRLFEYNTASVNPNIMIGEIVAVACGSSVASAVRKYYVTIVNGAAGTDVVRLECNPTTDALSPDLNIVTGLNTADNKYYYFLDTAFSTSIPYTFMFNGYIVNNTGVNSYGNVVDRASVTSITNAVISKKVGTVLPVGTTAERPAHRDGITRINSTTGKLEYSLGGSWISVP